MNVSSVHNSQYAYARTAADSVKSGGGDFLPGCLEPADTAKAGLAEDLMFADCCTGLGEGYAQDSDCCRQFGLA